MMTKFQAVSVVAATLTVLTIGVNLATGSRAYTRYPSEEVAAVNEQGDLGALFEDATGEASDGEEVLNTFALGWLPSGPGRDSLSVAAVAGLSVAAVVGVFAFERFAKHGKTKHGEKVTA